MQPNPHLNLPARLASLACTAALCIGAGAPRALAAEPARIVIDAGAKGTPVSPTLYGIFFEEINRAGDGGLYAEMLQNRSFEDGTTVPLAWEFVTSAGNDASWALDRSSPLNANNPTSLRVDVRTGSALCLPAKKSVAVFDITIDGDGVYVSTSPATPGMPTKMESNA